MISAPVAREGSGDPLETATSEVHEVSGGKPLPALEPAQAAPTQDPVKAPPTA